MPLRASPHFQTYWLAGKSWGDSPSPISTPSWVLDLLASPPTVISMDDLVVGTNNKKNKRPRQQVREAKKPKHLEEGCEIGDIEDFNFRECETLEIRASLLEWYDRSQRDLPWRRISNNIDKDDDESEKRAYAVWVSEVMLQQTRVQTVIDYFNRWTQKWPTLHHLAHASLEEVNEMWAGLGYYRRARFLLEGAKMIVEGGEGFPKTVCALRKVRGIGDYTAGAIASIAFKEAVPVVDGNVVRVIARLKAISANTKNTATIKNIWKLAGQLVDPCRPGDFNQALMELGAMICTPTSPSCSTCPVSGQCGALSVSRDNSSVLVTDYPIKVVKAKQRHDFAAVCVVEILEGQDIDERPQSDGRFLLVKRPDEGLLAGLWEFPSVALKGETDLATRREAVDHFLKKSFKIDTKKFYNVVLREEVGEYVHVFTHIRLKMHIELFVLHLKGGKNIVNTKQDKETMGWKYVDNEALARMGLTSGVRKVYTMVQKFKQSMFHPVPAKTTKKKTSRNKKVADQDLGAEN